ncbi:hypothetical protein CYMTET_23381 [Cymbomonas tetramitiformis]|uniref:Uncharacterized protein n=1 Tax=Cymbomonas tetramitiformis TaxID=36881 RepID=A0AAE0FYL1_9CHLO|nr:hypothetical protein CYMTET_23381 [Cymbomonas tetramitiformis]
MQVRVEIAQVTCGQNVAVDLVGTFMSHMMALVYRWPSIQQIGILLGTKGTLQSVGYRELQHLGPQWRSRSLTSFMLHYSQYKFLWPPDEHRHRERNHLNTNKVVQQLFAGQLGTSLNLMYADMYADDSGGDRDKERNGVRRPSIHEGLLVAVSSRQATLQYEDGPYGGVRHRPRREGNRPQCNSEAGESGERNYVFQGVSNRDDTVDNPDGSRYRDHKLNVYGWDIVREAA